MIPKLNLPNRITVSRLLVSLALFLVLTLTDEKILERDLGGFIAFVLFLIAASTDWLDGYLARKRGEVTVFGRIMDPFVDKVVVCGSFILLTPMVPALHLWMVVVIVAREFFVNAIRGFMESQGVSFAAERAGKIKMVLQCMAIGAMLLQIAIGAPESGTPVALDLLARILVWAATLSTLHSGWLYAKKASLAFQGADI